MPEKEDAELAKNSTILLSSFWMNSGSLAFGALGSVKYVVRKISVDDSLIPCSIVTLKFRESEYLISIMPASGSFSIIGIDEDSK